MKFSNTRTMNFEGAFRGLRNPLESWNKSDSYFGIGTYADTDEDFEVADAYCEANEISVDDRGHYNIKQDEYAHWLRKNGVLYFSDNYELLEYAFIGPKDLNLAQRMIAAGSSDRKFLRQIFVSVDITAPLYFWKELDTYKIGTVANSTSTMHKLASTPITFSCFEKDDFQDDIPIFENEPYQLPYNPKDAWEDTINLCETLRQRYNETKDKRYWKELIRILPESWLQKRTWTANYETIRNIYSQRCVHPHRLTEWKSFGNWVKELPYSKELIQYKL